MQEQVVRVNDALVAVDALPHQSALDWLRSRGYLGAKEGCAEGECGACAVLVARPGVAAATEWVALNACLMPAAALADAEIWTAEGLGTPERLHPVQREMAVRGGSQCGYCTPGFICAMAAEYYRPDRGEHFDLHALSGNLCRCTGYRPIRDAAQALGHPDPTDPMVARLAGRDAAPQLGSIASPGFLRPKDLPAALQALAENPGARVIAGGTDIGVEINIGGARPDLLIAIGHLDELRQVTIGVGDIEVGAAVPLADIERRLGGAIPLLAQVLPQFASRLIRNSATIGGNLGTGSPIGDLAPALLALDTDVVLVSSRGSRQVALADYFTGYRTTVRAPDELIGSVVIPRRPATITAFHKIAKRRFDDISSVAVAFAIDIDANVVRRASIGLGGVAATPIRARATEVALVGREWNAETVKEAAGVMRTEGTPLDDHRASAAYRTAMLGQALMRLQAETGEVTP